MRATHLLRILTITALPGAFGCELIAAPTRSQIAATGGASAGGADGVSSSSASGDVGATTSGGDAVTSASAGGAGGASASSSGGAGGAGGASSSSATSASSSSSSASSSSASAGGSDPSTSSSASAGGSDPSTSSASGSGGAGGEGAGGAGGAGAGGAAAGAGGAGAGGAGAGVGAGAGGGSSASTSTSGVGAGAGGGSASVSSASSGSSSASGTGGAGGAPIANDTCPGTAIDLPVGQTTTVFGTTSGAVDDYKTFCADPSAATSAPDVVYQLNFPSDCTMSLWLNQDPGFQGALGFRSTCDADALCIATSPAGPSLKMAVAAGSYWVVVDGANGTSGSFSLDVTCDAPICGDGVVNAGEECDGGPGVTPTDGCGDPGTPEACKVQQTVAADTCATVVATQVAAGHLLLPVAPPPYNTIGANDDYHSADIFCSPNPAVDQVFGFTPQASGTLTISVGADENGNPYCLMDPFPAGCWNHNLYVREADCEAGAELACSYPNFEFDNGVNSVAIPVTAGTTYYLFVDGSDMTIYDSGPYYLDITLQ